MNNGKLTRKQQKFVEFYIRDENASTAARRAGYSRRSAGVQGHQNLKKPQIAAAVKAKQAALAAKLSTETEINARWVLDRAVALHERCMKKGLHFAPAAACRALELIAKHTLVDALAHDQQYLHVHIEGLTGRLAASRLRVIDKPNAPDSADGDEEQQPMEAVN